MKINTKHVIFKLLISKAKEKLLKATRESKKEYIKRKAVINKCPYIVRICKCGDHGVTTRIAKNLSTKNPITCEDIFQS